MILNFLFRRLLYLLPMLLITTFIVFSLILLIPGDPVLSLLGANATPEKIEALRTDLGLNKPVTIQYFDWLKHAVQGNLGQSILTGQDVYEAVSSRLLVTIQLVVVALIISIIGGGFFAIVSVFFQGSFLDHIARFLGTLGAAVPSFWLAMLLVLLFSHTLGWLPATGFTSVHEDPALFVKGILIPAFSLGVAGVAEITRHLRSSLSEVMNSDYIRTAYSKGFSRQAVIFKHALQNAMLPVVTTIGILFGNMLGATVVIETVFGIPGMGQLAVNAILQRDFTVLQEVILVMVLMIILINFITDVIYAYLDPRIKY